MKKGRENQGVDLCRVGLTDADIYEAMHATKTLHPPGSATALIAVIGGEKIHNLGYLHALVPVTAGAAVLLLVALMVNNISKTRRYPEFWM